MPNASKPSSGLRDDILFRKKRTFATQNFFPFFKECLISQFFSPPPFFPCFFFYISPTVGCLRQCTVWKTSGAAVNWRREKHSLKKKIEALRILTDLLNLLDTRYFFQISKIHISVKFHHRDKIKIVWDRGNQNFICKRKFGKNSKSFFKTRHPNIQISSKIQKFISRSIFIGEKKVSRSQLPAYFSKKNVKFFFSKI